MSDFHTRLPDELLETGARIQRELRTAWRRVMHMPALDLVAPLTLILLLLYPGSWAEVRVAFQLGAVAGLLYRPLWSVSGFWFVLAALMGAYCIVTWHDADNHKYLIAYWCLALGLSCNARDQSQALRINARLLIGLCFLLAVYWKLRTPDFLTGDFYEFVMLTDDRLFAVAQLFTDMQPETYFQNRAAVDRLTAYSSTLTQVSLDGASRVRSLSVVVTAWTVFIEAWVAASFLWPSDSAWASSSRDSSLLVFTLTTYVAAPVSGFAWILLILGLAQVRLRRAVWRPAYLGVLAVVILYQLDPVNALLVWLES